jgi:serine protease Do
MGETAAQKVDKGPHWVHGLVKLVACTVGLPLSVLAIASLIGSWTSIGWVQLTGAVIIVLVVPLVVADRLLPNGDLRSARGLVTDVLALGWMAVATITVALGPGALREPLHAEANRLDERGWTRAAAVARWLAPDADTSDDAKVVIANVHAAEPEPEPSAAEVDVPEAIVTSVDSAQTGEESEDTDEPTPEPKTQTSKPRQPVDPAELFETWAPSVVTVKMKTSFGFGGTGTGFIVSSDGLIATNEHVISGGEGLEVKLFDDTVVDEVEVLLSDATVDLAILKVKTDHELVPVELGDSEAVKVGEPVIVIGNPLGLEHTLSDGLLSARRLYEGKRYIQMTAPVSPGNSGGPVFNRYGEVIGVTVAKIGYRAGENLNLAVPVDQLRPLLESPEKGGRKGGSRW